MFDLLSFLRQIMPPSRRTKTTWAFVRVIFGPIRFLMDAMELTRTNLLAEARGTGQVAILEELIRRNTGVNVYILDGNQVSVDFQLIVPPGISHKLGDIRRIVNRYKLPSKRYFIGEQANYGIVDSPGAEMAWVDGYPLIRQWENETPKLVYALRRPGIFRVVIKEGENILLDQDEAFIGQHDEHYLVGIDPSKTFTITAGTLSAKIVGKVKENLNMQAGYEWKPEQNRTLFVGLNSPKNPSSAMRLAGTTALISHELIPFSVQFAGVTYAYRLRVDNLAYGSYELIFYSGEDPVPLRGYIDLRANNGGQGALSTTPSPPPGPNNNQPPYVANPLPDRTITVNQQVNYAIPNSTFADSDGQIVSVVLTGLPPGTSYQNGAIVGAPTQVGTFNLVATATDDRGATISDPFIWYVANVDNGGGGGNTAGILVDPPANPERLDIGFDIVTIDGVKWARLKLLTPPPQLENGCRHMWWISPKSRPFYDSFPTDLFFPPGTFLSIYYGQGSTNRYQGQGFTKKAQQFAYIGTL